jgi:hypothetical protein
MDRIHAFLGFILLFVLVLFCGCAQESKQGLQSPVLFEFYTAPSAPVTANQDSTLGIRESKWLDNSSLQVNALVSIKCGEKILGGEYELSENMIILKYRSPRCNESTCADYMCNYKLAYKFTNLKKKDYAFELKRTD